MRKRQRSPIAGSLSELATRSLVLLCQRRLSAEGLAVALGVSTITAKRLVGALRAGGYRVEGVRHGMRACYEVRDARTAEELNTDPLLRTVVRSRARERRKPEDADYLED